MIKQDQVQEMMLQDCPSGAFFMWENRMYMKLNDENYEYNAVDLQSGKLLNMSYDLDVIMFFYAQFEYRVA